MFPAMFAVEFAMVTPVLAIEVTMQPAMLPWTHAFVVRFAMHVVEIVMIVGMLPIKAIVIIVVGGLVPILRHGRRADAERQE